MSFHPHLHSLPMETHTTLMDMHFEHRDAIAGKKQKQVNVPFGLLLTFRFIKRKRVFKYRKPDGQKGKCLLRTKGTEMSSSNRSPITQQLTEQHPQALKR